MAETMFIQVREERLRATPSFLSTGVDVVRYGQEISVRESQGSWRRIDLQGQRGWVHVSALTEHEIELSADQDRAKLVASDDELALAGKGFTKQVEEKYRKRHQNVRFSGVDRLEMVVISAQEIEQFIGAGGLQPQEEVS